MRAVQAILSQMPDPDEALRNLSNVLRVPLGCRKQACRHKRRCQGGYGPPCYFEKRDLFARALREQMHEHRLYWDEQRAAIKALGDKHG